METTIINEKEVNADLVRRGYEAFNNADIATLNEIFHADSTWNTPGNSPVAGSRKGKDAIFGLFGHYGHETAGTFRAHLKNVCPGEDGYVVAIHRNTGERNGKTLDVDCCIVFQFKDGLAVSGTEYFFDLGAWNAFWN